MGLKAEAVVFDLFGTLVPSFSKGGYEPCLRGMARDLDVPLEPFRRAWNGQLWQDRVMGQFTDAQESIARACQIIGAHPPRDQVEAALARRLDYERSLLVPYDEVLPTFMALRRGGMRIGLISNCAMELVPLWDDTELSRHIDVAILSAAVHMAKPDPRIYELACRRLEAEPGRCLYVGDGSDDELPGAAAVGMHAVLVAPKSGAAARKHDAAARWDGPRIKSIADVPAVLG